MEVFLIVFQRLIPLYALVAAGFVLGRVLEVRRESVATILIFFVSPLVFFNGAAAVNLTAGGFSLPVLIYLLACGICLAALRLARRWWRGPTPYLAAFAAGNANSGYFGLPVALAVLGERSLGLAVMASFGFTLYENTLGYFVTARGRSTAGESLRKALRLPAVYAFAAGLLCNYLGWKPQLAMDDFFRNVRGAYSVLGMMMVGLGVSTMRRLVVDRHFVAFVFFAKFGVWPLVMLALVQADRHWLHFYSPDAHKILILMSAVPLAANTVAIAASLNVEAEKAGVAVLLSTAFALFYIPIVALYFL
jgi:predicted permease